MVETDSAGAILDEISSDEVQGMMDQMLGEQSFDFSDYVGGLVQGKMPVSVSEFVQTVLAGVHDNLMQQRKMYLYLILIAVVGAVITNFSKLLQGKQVSETAFYSVYILFFSVLAAAFTDVTAIAQGILEQLLDFMKVLAPTYFMSMTFVQGAAATGVYYEFTLVMITLVDYVLVHFALPAINLYFLLQIANQLSEEEMFSKMAELIRDVVRMVMKTMFGVMMGINVIQGLILPVTAEVKNSAVVRIGGAIPGVGNTISNVASTVLSAGTLVKNAVGVAGVIAVFLICVIPLLRLVVCRFCYQIIAAVIQPISDRRVIRCFGAVTESVQMLIYAVSVGCMMFIISIVVVSAMT